MRVAALDLGSNTTLLTIADVGHSGEIQVLHDETSVTRLGQGVHQARKFHPDALTRMKVCLEKYAETIKVFKATKVIAVATSAARDVANREDLLAIGQKLSIPIQVVSGEVEAQLTFVGALSDRKSLKNIAVVDVGGGSTEVIRHSGYSPIGVSIDVGSVRLTELLVSTHPIPPAEYESVREYCGRAFQQAHLSVTGAITEVVAVAGTPTTLAGLILESPFNEAKIHGFQLSLGQIEEWSLKLSKLTIEEREALPGMQPKRADVIVAGSQILASALKALQTSKCTVSTRGVRFGILKLWQKL